MKGSAGVDRDDVEILFAHLQTSLVVCNRTVPSEALAGAATTLAEVGAALGLPMTCAVVPERGDLVPGLATHATEAATFPRHAASPSLDPATRDVLSAGGGLSSRTRSWSQSAGAPRTAR